MIRAAIAKTGLPQRLTAKAAALARAAAENRHREGRADSARWRKARLLWPLFTRGGR